ncbi:LysM peptidoglycan-binding domain-containing protein [Mycolicibacterium peregrinum]|uniref:Peptidoglycan-binding protein LysM n=1 Tax=Mycolicibacterium peregrinum TaxID=43304 RepID=A0A1A0W7G1_MYCPR|nr:LysM peptidoglycan-binding domain-containing protein [Mycolicibacterium peregrinum]OBB91972.1 peptidoglycan-binding protein LysM [Mycolicibacterium peregrinum]
MKNYTVTLGDTLFGIAEREYGDGGLYPVIAEQNHLSNPALIDIGQELLIPYVTYRYLFSADDGTAVRQQLTQSFYGTQSAAIQFIWEVVNGVAQREIHRGTWLLLPDLTNVGHHTVAAAETFAGLAGRWYGDDHLAAVVANANGLDASIDPTPGQVLIVPGLNRRRHLAGDTLQSMCVEEYGDHDVKTRAAVAAAANYITRPDTLFSSQVVHFPS